MEALMASCPAQFSGQAGALFAHAISAVVAAHCAHSDSVQWPRDDADHIIQAGGGKYDFIVVGAGTAGSLVANRLGQVSGWNILLVEAGDDPTFDSEVPAFLFSNQDTKQDWQHKTTKNQNHCLASKDGACKWAKGKGMGGSNSINAMLYVRGNKADYELWKVAGNPGWGYDGVLPYFKKTENFSSLNEIDGREYHGQGGEMNVEPFLELRNPWKDIVEQAWGEMGYKYNEDINGESQIGISNVPGSVKDGRRHNSAKYLLNDAKKRGNLHIMKNTIVTKVTIDPVTKNCRGVHVKHDSGAVMEIEATKEVILSAGTIKTPQILMLSGIGPKDHIMRKNINPIIDLPVGKNLQDHAIFPVFVQIPEEKSIAISNAEIVQFIIEYMLMRTGPFRGIGMTDLLGFVDTKNNSEVPDVQFHHIYFGKNDRVILPAYRQATGYVDEFWEILNEMNRNSDIIGMYPTLLRPKSRGEVLLRNRDPNSNPEVHANYFEDEDDLNTLVRGVDFILKLLKTPVFKKIGAKVKHFNLKSCKDFDFSSDHYWKCYIRNVASTIYHPVGTAKMGPASDSTTVVGPDLSVHGLNGLRIVDACIMPTVPSGNTMSPTLMIAEKASDIIKQYHTKNVKNEL